MTTLWPVTCLSRWFCRKAEPVVTTGNYTVPEQHHLSSKFNSMDISKIGKCHGNEKSHMFLMISHWNMLNPLLISLGLRHFPLSCLIPERASKLQKREIRWNSRAPVLSLESCFLRSTSTVPPGKHNIGIPARSGLVYLALQQGRFQDFHLANCFLKSETCESPPWYMRQPSKKEVPINPRPPPTRTTRKLQTWPGSILLLVIVKETDVWTYLWSLFRICQVPVTPNERTPCVNPP